MGLIIYETLKKEDILNKFYNLSLNKSEIFNLYIHSPFCINQCSYCKHKGASIKTNAKEYREYYESYLPNLIEFYSPVLEKHTPNTVYFGGGSSSVMTTKDMERIFNKIPNFDRIADKTFECDINLLTEEKIKILINHNFTKISFGVQTFNERILKKNNRTNPDFNKIKEIVKLFQEHNISVNCDLMTFIDNEDETDFKQLIIDMKKMTNIIQPNKMTIYPKSSVIRKFIENGNTQGAIKIISNLQKNMIKNMPSFNNYCATDIILSYQNKEIITKYIATDYSFYKTKKDMKNYALEYNSTAYPQKNTVLFAIGGFKNHESYSYINEDFFILESNFNNNIEDIKYKRITVDPIIK